MQTGPSGVRSASPSVGGFRSELHGVRQPQAQWLEEPLWVVVIEGEAAVAVLVEPNRQGIPPTQGGSGSHRWELTLER